MSNQKKPVNGFLYVKGKSVYFIDLVTEKSSKYNIEYFSDAFKERNVDENCIVLANRANDSITTLYKCKISTKDIKAHMHTKDDLIKLCYSLCIKLFSKTKNYSSES